MELKHLTLMRMILDNIENCTGIKIIRGNNLVHLDFRFNGECGNITWKIRKEYFEKHINKLIPKELEIKS